MALMERGELIEKLGSLDALRRGRRAGAAFHRGSLGV
jgi:hypothetical protein